MGDGEKLPEFDHSDYNVVVFDEVKGLQMLDRIREFVKQFSSAKPASLLHQ